MKEIYLLKEIFEEMNDMMHIKGGGETPTKGWEVKYRFLQRRVDYFKKKLLK